MLLKSSEITNLTDLVDLAVLCWQFTAAGTSWESTTATWGPRSKRARGRCRCDAGGPSRRGTASCRGSSSSPCPAQTRSPGQSLSISVSTVIIWHLHKVDDVHLDFSSFVLFLYKPRGFLPLSHNVFDLYKEACKPIKESVIWVQSALTGRV